MNKYYIIEHPSRGCFIGTVNNKLKCSYTILRTDRKVTKFEFLSEAVEIAKMIKGSYILRFDATKPKGKRVEQLSLAEALRRNVKDSEVHQS